MSDSVTPWTAACQASLTITNSQSLLKLMSIELVMSSNHLVLCHPFSSFGLVESGEQTGGGNSQLGRWWGRGLSVPPGLDHQAGRGWASKCPCPSVLVMLRNRLTCLVPSQLPHPQLCLHAEPLAERCGPSTQHRG